MKPSAEVEVLVDDDTVSAPTWCYGELMEWAHYSSVGWTGYVRYSTGVGQNRLGRFLAEHIRQT